MPTQRLFQNVVQIEMISFPFGNRTADLQRHWPLLPDILNAGPYHLLRIYVEHLWFKVGIVRLRSQVPETVQPPAGASAGSICECVLFVEVHQQRCMRERIEPDVDQSLLIGEGGHVRTPAFTPITD